MEKRLSEDELKEILEEIRADESLPFVFAEERTVDHGKENCTGFY